MAVLVVAMATRFGCTGVNAGCVPVNEQSEVINAIEPYISDWRILGEELGLRPARLEAIDIDNRDTRHKLRATIRAWYNENPESCWEHVIQALVNMNEKKLAKKIADDRGVDWELFSSTTGSKTKKGEGITLCGSDGMKHCSRLTYFSPVS